MTYVLEPPQQLTLLFARIYNKYMHEKCVHVWLNVCNILHNKLNSCKIQPHFQLEFFIFSVCDVLVLNGYSTSQICWVWLVFFFLILLRMQTSHFIREHRESVWNCIASCHSAIAVCALAGDLQFAHTATT